MELKDVSPPGALCSIGPQRLLLIRELIHTRLGCTHDDAHCVRSFFLYMTMFDICLVQLPLL